MTSKRILTRIKHKHEVEADWNKATSFVPYDGELIVYDADTAHPYPRFKVGDASTTVVNLPFSDAEYCHLDDIEAVSATLTGHTGNTTIHITSTERTNWNAAKTHADSAHNYIPTSQKGAASGVATLDTNGKVPTSQLPSYVDDVLEYSAKSSFPTTGETGKIYVDTATNKTYRWGGSAYVEISASLAIGTTSSTAAAGNHTHSNYIPTSRTVNGKALSSNITLTAADVGALPSTTTIPTVNNATLTIQKNGTTVKTFTANSSSDVIANITVPTGAAADKGVDTSIAAASTSTNLPTSKAVAAFVEGKGYKTTDNNGYHTTGSWSDLTYTATANGGAGELKFTIPTGTSSTTVAVGNHTHSYVPTSRTVNGKALSSNISLTAADVGALPSSTTIPTVNNATLTIQKNGTTVKTFTANSSSNVTANITVPTKTSELTNDSGFKTTDTNTTYTFATGSTNGTISVTPSGGTAQSVAVKGLGSAAYTASTAYATAAQGTKADNALPKTGGNISGHIYLTGANATSSTGSTSQIVFGTSSNNHVVLSSNNNALVINPDTGSTTNQIVLYLDQPSQFPYGISTSSNIYENGTALANKYAPAYTYSTTDLTAGSSALTTGKLYFVYE